MQIDYKPCFKQGNPRKKDEGRTRNVSVLPAGNLTNQRASRWKTYMYTGPSLGQLELKKLLARFTALFNRWWCHRWGHCSSHSGNRGNGRLFLWRWHFARSALAVLSFGFGFGRTASSLRVLRFFCSCFFCRSWSLLLSAFLGLLSRRLLWLFWCLLLRAIQNVSAKGNIQPTHLRQLFCCRRAVTILLTKTRKGFRARHYYVAKEGQLTGSKLFEIKCNGSNANSFEECANSPSTSTCAEQAFRVFSRRLKSAGKRPGKIHGR